MKKFVTMCAALALAASPAYAGLIDTRTDATGGGAVVDQSLGANEYGPGNSYQYLGGGTGFGGTVGNGALYLESDATNLYIGMQFGNALNDLVGIMIDSKAGGFTDATMNDNGDGCRKALTQQSINADDAYSPGFLADYGVCFGNFGNVLFELTADPNPINFLNFDGTGSQPFREYAIPLASIGVAPGGSFDFIVSYTADSGFGSNESIPAWQALNSGPNPGFDPTSAGYGNHDRFNTPEPTTLSLIGLGALALIRRKR
jgi:PEP-CTERM motif